MIENKKEFKLIIKKNPRSLLPNALTICCPIESHPKKWSAE